MSSLQRAILPYLPAGYVFLNYKYTIAGSPLVTYHRDVTSSQRSQGTKYPTYTAIHYEYEGNFLSVSPGSHRRWTFGMPVTLSGFSNTVILFDSDLVHAVLPAPKGVCRIVTQYKIAHADDLDRLDHLRGVKVTQNGDLSGGMSLFLRGVSYIFTVPIEIFGRSFVAGYLQRLFPLQNRV